MDAMETPSSLALNASPEGFAVAVPVAPEGNTVSPRQSRSMDRSLKRRASSSSPGEPPMKMRPRTTSFHRPSASIRRRLVSRSVAETAEKMNKTMVKVAYQVQESIDLANPKEDSGLSGEPEAGCDDPAPTESVDSAPMAEEVEPLDLSNSGERKTSVIFPARLLSPEPEPEIMESGPDLSSFSEHLDEPVGPYLYGQKEIDVNIAAQSLHEMDLGPNMIPKPVQVVNPYRRIIPSPSLISFDSNFQPWNTFVAIGAQVPIIKFRNPLAAQTPEELSMRYGMLFPEPEKAEHAMTWQPQVNFAEEDEYEPDMNNNQ